MLLLLPQLRYQHALASIAEVEGRGVVEGQVYRVRVLQVLDYGAYVALPNGLPAMLHIRWDLTRVCWVCGGRGG